MDAKTLALIYLEKARLRKTIAEHEGWLDVEIYGADCVIGYSPNGQLTYVPNYFTDPAVVMRMSKELIQNEYWPTYLLDDYDKETWWWHPGGLHADSYEYGTMKAYAAMMEKK